MALVLMRFVYDFNKYEALTMEYYIVDFTDTDADRVNMCQKNCLCYTMNFQGCVMEHFIFSFSLSKSS